MCLLIIKTDLDNERSYNLKNYHISVKGENLHLLLDTDEVSINYSICTDQRSEDISTVKNYITTLLQESLSTGKCIKISEDRPRIYLRIEGEGDNDRKQFTGKRI